MNNSTRDDKETEWVGLWQEREDVREETRHIDHWDSVKPRPLLMDGYDDENEDEEQFED